MEPLVGNAVLRKCGQFGNSRAEVFETVVATFQFPQVCGQSAPDLSPRALDALHQVLEPSAGLIEGDEARKDIPTVRNDKGAKSSHLVRLLAQDVLAGSPSGFVTQLEKLLRIRQNRSAKTPDPKGEALEKDLDLADEGLGFCQFVFADQEGNQAKIELLKVFRYVVTQIGESLRTEHQVAGILVGDGTGGQPIDLARCLLEHRINQIEQAAGIFASRMKQLIFPIP